MQFECCSDTQYLSIILIIAYALFIFKLWRVPILHPFKILTVFLHELGHATAAWLTGGKVTGMEVHPDEGGVTKTVGGIQCIILPAGYLGSAFYGMAMIISSGNKVASAAMAFVLIFFLFVFLFFAKNWYLRVLNCGFMLLLSGFLVVDFMTKYSTLSYVILFMGVMSCLFSIYDIYDDLISRRINESDASVFAKMTHTSSRCWGVIWGIFALITLGLAIYLHLLVIYATHKEKETTVSSFDQLSKRTKATLGVVCGLVFLSILHTIVTRQCKVK